MAMQTWAAGAVLSFVVLAACTASTGSSEQTPLQGNDDASIAAADGAATSTGGGDGGARAADASASDASVPVDSPWESAPEYRVRELVNEARARGATCGTEVFPPTTPVGFNALLALSSRMHSADMCARQYFDHTNPDGKTPFDRMKAAGYTYSYAGENIAAGQDTPEEVTTAWMNSPGHCKNIMKADFKELGVGYATCGDKYKHYWTQNFGTKAP